MTLVLRLGYAGLAFTLGVGLLGWLLSLWRRDAGVADALWGVCIAGAGVVYAAVDGRWPVRACAMLGMAALWALRLSVYMLWRNHGQPEDRRYRQMRERHAPHFGLKSLGLVFGLQALLAWWVSAPLLAGVLGAAPPGAMDAAGALLALFGLIFETVADAQLSHFKRQPANAGRVLDHGLWRCSRHPNYFGEACFWWGQGLMALAAGWPVALLAPLLMTLLLLKVSGVSLLEQDIGERRPAYRDYILHTPAFVPRWPKGGWR